MTVQNNGVPAELNAERTNEVGSKIRLARLEKGITLRALARVLEVSPGHISQVERGIVSPSVSLLYEIVTHLELSMDYLFGDADGSGLGRSETVLATTPHEEQFVTRYQNRKAIDLPTGVRWELLTPTPRDQLDLREIIYQPGSGSSAGKTEVLRHQGREYGLILEGVLHVQLEFEEFTIGPGDTIVFDSEIPHRMWNNGPESVRAIWASLAGSSGEPCPPEAGATRPSD